MQQVRTYELHTNTGYVQKLVLQLTSQASILSVTKSGPWIALHCMVDTNAPKQTRVFNVYTTNATVPDNAVYIGTVLFGCEGDYALHVFDETLVK